MSTMDSIRIDVGIKRIAINDDPKRVIEFNPKDVDFAERFYQLIEEFDAKMKEFQQRASLFEDISGLSKEDIPDNMAERFGFAREVCTFIKERIDHLFGKGTSKIAFGDAVSFDMFTQFFNGITPFIRDARTEQIAKFTDATPKKVMK